MNKFMLSTAIAAVAIAGAMGSAAARDQIQIAGSSTVLPYAKIVAEQFGETFTNFKTPVVESGGTRRRHQGILQGRRRRHHRHRQLLAPDQEGRDRSLRRARREGDPGSQVRL